ncbi:MAG: porin family protein [Ferruginibacter sp.]
MKKVVMLFGFVLSGIAVYAQLTKQEVDWLMSHCNPQETYDQCKARVYRETMENKSREDSIMYARIAANDKAAREHWEAEKERRDKLTPEQRKKEDEDEERHVFDQKKKKIDDGSEIDGGINFSTLTGDNPDYTTSTGVHLGIFIRVIHLSDAISLGMGADYSMQGGKTKAKEYITGGNYGSSSTTSRLTYLNLPILIHYQAQRKGGFFAEAGVQPGFLLSAKSKGTTTTDIKANVEKFDIGIPIGVGYHFKNKFGVGLRFTPGLMNVNKDKQFTTRNMVTSFRASYSL